MGLVSASGEPIATPKKIVICVPSGDEVKTAFARSLMNLVAYTAMNRPQWGIAVNFGHGSVLPQLRQMLADEALADEATHVLWLDSDMSFPADALIRLMEHDVPVVGCDYPRRYPPHSSTANVEYTGDGPLYRAKSMGFGCILVQADVFKRLPKPWFALAWSDKRGEFAGEDVFFCRLLGTIGLAPLVDRALSEAVSHHGASVLTLDLTRPAPQE